MKNPYIIAAVVIVVILLFVFAGSAFAKSPDKISPDELKDNVGSSGGTSNLQNLITDVLATGGDNSSCGKTCRQLCASKKPSLWPFDCGPRCKCKRSCKSDCAAGKDVTKIQY